MKSMAIAWVIATLVVVALTVGCTASTPDDNSATGSTPISTSSAASTSEPTRAIDCEQATSGQATSDTEKTVCADPALVALDSRLADIYQQAISESGSERATLEAEQRGWVAGRDDCWKEVDARQCVLESYQTRLVELQINGKDTVTPATVEYRCGDGSTPVSSVFYNDTDPRAMVLTVGGDQAILMQQPTGSGIRYTRQGVEYAEHQGDITVDFYGPALACVAAK
jgi:uncharacterized protein